MSARCSPTARSRSRRRDPAPGGEVFQTTAPPPGTYHFTSTGLTTADCTGTLPAAPERAGTGGERRRRHAHRAIDHVR